MTNTRYTYNLNRWREATQGTSSSSSDRYYTVRWDDPWEYDDDSFVGRLKDIKWKFDQDPYLEFVEVRNEKAPKLPDNYPRGDIDNLLGIGGD